MLKVLLRHAAPLARASFSGVAVPSMHALLVVVMASAGFAWAPAAQAAEAASTEAAVSTPFKHYQAWRAVPLQDWRKANERVGEIGGWRTYLRESQQGGDGADRGQEAHHGHQGH